jgi:peptide/nickel transport system ATP-binding protein
MSIAFGPFVHGLPKAEALARATELLQAVGLEPALFANRYPHELSGGQRQRINVARAIALEPRIVILDEAVSALDKSVEAQVLNLLVDLKARFDLTYVFISHDLNVVRYISDRVMVMYLGKIIEIGPVDRVYLDPRHPYTRALISAMPSMDPRRRTHQAPLSGDAPNPIRPPSGCRFRTRCPFAEKVCETTPPALLALPPDKSWAVACHMHLPGSGHTRASTKEPT